MQRLKELRLRKRYSQDRLAMELGTSQTTISYYETGERSPDADFIRKAARFFHVSTDYLLELINDDTDIHANTAYEDKLLREFRKLDDAGKQKSIAYIEGILDSEK